MEWDCEFMCESKDEMDEHEATHPTPEFTTITTKTWNGYKHRYIRKE